VFFSLFGKKTSAIDASVLHVDIHSHLIPGIDDGARDMEESLLLLKGLRDLGYQKVITTPHIMSDAYRNDSTIILQGLGNLRAAAEAEEISIIVEAGAEYYLDEGFPKHLHAQRVMSINDEYLLFETSYVSKPMQMEEMIFEIASSGFTPILAHPERYRYIKEPEKEYGRWKELGVLFQVNLNSFSGYYGRDAKEKALFLRDEGMIDFLGSDMHGKKHLDGLGKVLSSSLYRSIYEKNTILNNTLL